MLKSIIIFVIALIVLLASFGSNTDSNMIARLGMESSAWLIALVSLGFAGILCTRHPALVAVTLIAAIFANAPADMALGLSPDIFAALFIALLLIPIVLHYMDT